MTPELWRRVAAAFERVRSLPPGEIDAALEHEAGGDTDLAREVRALLRAGSEPDEFLDGGAARLIRRPAGSVLCGRFRLERFLGEGGMGEVWEATDTALSDSVALKLLRASLRQDPALLSRFKRELQLARRVSHPNVCRVFEFLEDPSAAFLTMELVSGQTLAARLREAGGFRGAAALDIIRQLGNGLAAAHEAGVIHRDLKPSNVMLSGARAVVMDFGLARSGPPSLGSSSAAGTLAGTPEYMAPEQISGGDVGVAADIYAFGLLIFEIFEGAPPFGGRNTFESWLRRVRERPPALTAAGIPPRANEVIARCLEYDAAKRFPSVLAALETLERKKGFDWARLWPWRSRQGPAPVIACPPDQALREVDRVIAGPQFEDSPDAATLLRYLVDEAIEGRAPAEKEIGIRVFGRDESFDVKRDPVVRVQARRVRAKLDQFYREASPGEGLRVALPDGLAPHVRPATPVPDRAESAIGSIAVLPVDNLADAGEIIVLCDGLTESIIRGLTRLPHLRVLGRSTTFAFKGRTVDPRQVGREFGVTHVLAGSIRSVGDQLRVALELTDSATGFQVWSEEREGPRAKFVELQDELVEAAVKRAGGQGVEMPKAGLGLDAYQLYYEGRQQWRVRNPRAIRNALSLFERARKADAKFALACAGISDCYMIAGMHGVYPPRWVFPRAKRMALRALRLDPTLGEVHASLGLVEAAYHWNYEAAEQAFRRALDLNPGYSTAYHWRAIMYLIPHGCFPEAAAQLRLAANVDPLSSVVRADLAICEQILGNAANARAAFEEGLRLDPSCTRTLYARAYVLERQGRYADALRALDGLAAALPDSEGHVMLTGTRAAVHGMAGETTAAETRLQQLLMLARRGYVSEYFLAFAHLGIGDRASALRWLEAGCKQRCGGMNWLSADPRWRSLAGEPRFQELITKLGLLSFHRPRS